MRAPGLTPALRSRFWIALWGAGSLSICLASACRTSLLRHPTKSETDDWTLVVVKAHKGPDTYRARNGYIEPQSGAHFFSFDIRLTNLARVGRWFNYDWCDLDAGKERILPSIVRYEPQDELEAPEFEPLAPGREIVRTLIFAYPDDQKPTRLACGTLSIPLRPMKSPTRWR
jgi:hypothetical protein